MYECKILKRRSLGLKLWGRKRGNYRVRLCVYKHKKSKGKGVYWVLHFLISSE